MIGLLITILGGLGWILWWIIKIVFCVAVIVTAIRVAWSICKYILYKTPFGDKPANNKHPAITLEQFKAFYKTAPNKWSWDGDNGTVKYYVKNIQEILRLGLDPDGWDHEYYDGYYKTFSYPVRDADGFYKFLKHEQKLQKAENDARYVAECLTAWKADAETAEARANAEIEKARKQYERLLNNHDGETVHYVITTD